MQAGIVCVWNPADMPVSFWRKSCDPYYPFLWSPRAIVVCILADPFAGNVCSKWAYGIVRSNFKQIPDQFWVQDTMFSFLASGVKKYYDIGETLGKWVIAKFQTTLILPLLCRHLRPSWKFSFAWAPHASLTLKAQGKAKCKTFQPTPSAAFFSMPSPIAILLMHTCKRSTGPQRLNSIFFSREPHCPERMGHLGGTFFVTRQKTLTCTCMPAGCSFCLSRSVLVCHVNFATPNHFVVALILRSRCGFKEKFVFARTGKRRRKSSSIFTLTALASSSEAHSQWSNSRVPRMVGPR